MTTEYNKGLIDILGVTRAEYVWVMPDGSWYFKAKPDGVKTHRDEILKPAKVEVKEEKTTTTTSKKK
jgi:hypothetical protein